MPTSPLQAAIAERIQRPLEDAGLAARRQRLLCNARGRVLDVGTGIGANLSHYDAADGVTEVVALEPEAAVVERLRRHLPESRVPVEVVEAGIDDAPFEAGSFDTIVCTLVLCTVPDVDRALVTIRELLADDGQLLFLEHVRSAGPWRHVQRALTPAWQTIVPGCHLDRDPLSAMRAAGFIVTDCQRFTMPFTTSGLGLAVQGVARRSHRASQ